MLIEYLKVVGVVELKVPALVSHIICSKKRTIKEQILVVVVL
jgi:hypothetical protein